MTSSPANDPASGEAVEFIANDELELVLRRYDIGVVRKVVPLDRGSGRSPKVILQTDLGEYLLKKRTGRHADPDRTSAVHHLHLHLARHHIPVPQIVATKPNGRSMTRCGGALFELAQFVRGYSYDRSPAATRAAGSMLAHFHHASSSLSREVPAADQGGTYHNVPKRVSMLARKAQQVISDSEGSNPRDDSLPQMLEALVMRYANACQTVRATGFENWPSIAVHGDWHPGNLVFQENAAIAAVLDLDGSRIEPRATDIANGALQFSMRIGAGEPSDWPDSVDEVRLLAFCDGYDEFDEHFMLSRPEVRALPYLMIEALIAESLGPIAATGRFGRFTGRVFLDVVNRKSAWIEHHAPRVTRILGD